MMKKVDEIVIHCSATPPSSDIGASEIDEMHKARGWRGIGYHKVIRRDGTIENGRVLDDDEFISDIEVGAHSRGHNGHSVGICLVGGIRVKDGIASPEFNYTRRQMHALYGLLFEMIAQFPGATILGHRDLPGVTKACPCFNVREWMGRA
jgi:N-acetylmuramoyl-L-alanine amidase